MPYVPHTIEESSMSKKAKIEAAAGDAADFATTSVDQAQIAFDKAADLAQDNFQTIDAATSAFKSRAIDLQMKSVEIAQANMGAAFAFARQAFSVKDPSSFFQLNQDFARNQAQAFQKQAAELNELTVALAKETFKPMQDGLTKSFGAYSKTFAA
jgi:hypothetical protein